MPRIRSWQDLHLFRPDADARYKHINGLFTSAIDWPLIEAHVPDMLRVVLSVRAGRLPLSAILRRLATYSRKNRLYFAFRKLGRAIRTDFLLRYLGSVELRRAIGGATNKSELFNQYAQWVAFGSSGLAGIVDLHMLKIGNQLAWAGTAQQAAGSSEGFLIIRVLLQME